jgi:signal transduction histidine kinase
MLSYLAFIHHGIETAGNSLLDGKTLARACVKQLESLNDPEQFPPRLLVLLASPAYLDLLRPEQLLNGVHQIFTEAGHRDVPLIGCSVSAVFFNRRIHREGALLVCLASRLLKAKVEASPDASHDPEKAIKDLLKELRLFTQDDEEIHSLANRTLFAMFPGFGGNKYLAARLHELLRDHLKARISIFGGVASANSPGRMRSAVLFANREVRRNAVVAASVECGTPFGISLTQGLTDTGCTLNVAELDPQDSHIIRRFREGDVGDVMKQWENYPVVMFSNIALDRDPAVDTPTLEGETLRFNREVREREPFHLLIPEPKKMLGVFRLGVTRSRERAWLENPIGGLGFRCAGLLNHSEKTGQDLEYESALIERDLSLRDSPYEKPFVGGFVDGEAGVDKNGKSMLSNWSNATLVFGDELRDRTPIYDGFKKLASYAGMRVAETYKVGADRLTQLIYDIGFPGAMLSFCMRDQEQITIVGQAASGLRYKKLLDAIRYPLYSNDILAAVAREKQARPIMDPRREKCSSVDAACDAGIISQYIVPLIGTNDEVNALLQFDLGDISYDTQLHPTEKEVLDSLGKIVNSILNRTFKWEESKITSKLDQAMYACLSAETVKQGLQQYLEQALKAFGLKKGHIRIAQEDKHCLSLIAGIGDYFEESRKRRREIDFGDLSPTAQAFRDERIIIINDAKNNKSHWEMCERYEAEEALRQRLQEVESYANVPFKSERGERGTINLVSSRPWFFTWFHERALQALGERVGFLLGTLRRKQRESFLLGVSPQFSQIQDLGDISAVLANEIKRFAITVKAEFSSLYLWEEDWQRYILRAQYGWKKPGWINAARYSKDDFWAGTTALAGVPRHIPDLYKYYMENLYPPSARLYAKYTFGQDLSPEFTVEAIGLQLRIANDRLGVLTLYRPIQEGDESGFVTTDTELLQQGADNFAGLISILQAERKETWEKQEYARRQEVYEATIPAEGGDFESRVCRQALKSYGAIKARFYKVEIFGETPHHKLQASFQHNVQTDQIEQSLVSPDEEELVRMTMLANHRNEEEVLTDRVKLKGDERYDPKQVALEGLVRRACIPLQSEKRLVGLLDLHWLLNYRQAYSPDYIHNEALLRVLGEVVGLAYHRSQTKSQTESIRQQAEMKLYEGEAKLRESEDQTRDVVQTTSAYVLKHHHELRTIVQQMSSLLDSLRSLRKDPSEKEEKLIRDLLHKIRESDATIKRMIEIGRKMAYPAYERQNLRNLILYVLKESEREYADYEIEVNTTDISKDYWIWVDPHLIRIAFTYLIDNSIKSMKDKNQGKLNINAATTPSNEEVLITIQDTGIGMTEEEIQQVLKEFFSRNNRISVGVTIARMILGLHGGRLSYNSVKDEGTETLVTLPIKYSEGMI